MEQTRLKQLRLASKVTLRQLGEATGIAHPMISLMENGKQSINIEQAKKFAKFFGTSLLYILNESEDTTVEFKQMVVEAFLLGQTNKKSLPQRDQEIVNFLEIVIRDKPDKEDLSLLNDLFRMIVIRKRRFKK
jgi:transcriptional regulator with XRE-family HTH domain